MSSITFSTGVAKQEATFTVARAERSLVFRTTVARKKITFTIQNKLDKLSVGLSANKLFLEVRLPSYTTDNYSLHAIAEGSLDEAEPTLLPRSGVSGWYFPISEDGIWYLTILDEQDNIVAQQVALVNHHALRQLVRYRKRISPKLHESFERRCHYNALAILYYECGDFKSAADYLTLLRDVA